jgi:adenine-specific DNA methylase
MSSSVFVQAVSTIWTKASRGAPQAKQDRYAPGGLEGQIILDPMMGGGTTLHEAIRLGANVVGSDIDPIPVLQTRATLTDVADA